MKKIYKQSTDSWYLERIVFLVSGVFIVISSVLTLVGFSGWVYFTFLIGIMLINFAFFGYCPMAILLSKNGVKEK
ncbi:MAG: hypothetical protein UR69_C0002G0261 [Candidatus Moranbacteria bacterium GW2011_GWE2_35_2-]|nr:MAG: hypothetical protein UR69_C0002G0261 [Candidatus Moranbacteria bacterium GW2011_GWE2_35_2-]KKQ04127.1 MAG: hypothetical protein US15_C0067G0006 [Candidatus Moranbacteria bacterium GW2011_GWF1_36_4]KKQ22393.1 MAG: hypothetical protein US37_C0002G0018 [Candidatus Moranbacteria bacterium GW2011_GWF2_37_11]KKQ29461.1 MAG: hypothetical protein US44_C0001G0053 [Candidatus Moranbacteria bacterium GW2011_GWD1_37_17]KKQ30671.1 MAG: hypothetical protein US47_C0002G0261 [Candidatus Moranbacteria b